jgi:hypothetical protein
LGAQKFLSDNNYGPAGDGFMSSKKSTRRFNSSKKQVAKLTTNLQKVNAELELSNSVSQIAENNP